MVVATASPPAADGRVVLSDARSIAKHGHRRRVLPHHDRDRSAHVRGDGSPCPVTNLRPEACVSDGLDGRPSQVLAAAWLNGALPPQRHVRCERHRAVGSWKVSPPPQCWRFPGETPLVRRSSAGLSCADGRAPPQIPTASATSVDHPAARLADTAGFPGLGRRHG